MSTVSRHAWNRAFRFLGFGEAYLEWLLNGMPLRAIPTFKPLEELGAILWATRLGFASAPLTTYNTSFGLWVRGLAVGLKAR